MRVEHLELIVNLSTPTVHPDGSHVVVASGRPSLVADAYTGQLWRVPLDGGPAHRITRGFRDSAPSFSPDGRLLGFLRAEPGKPAQLAIMPAGGGEPMVITDTKLGVTEFAFSPDSAQLAYIAAVPEPGRHGTVEGVDAAHEDPRWIKQVQFHANGVGFSADRRKHLFVVEVPDWYAEPVIEPRGRAAVDAGDYRALPVALQFSQGDFDHHSVAWDGDAVLAVAGRHPGTDADLREDLYRFTGPDQAPVQLTAAAANIGVDGDVVVSGDWIMFRGEDLGPDALDFFGQNPGVFRIPRVGGEPLRLTEAEGTYIAFGPVVDDEAVLAIRQQRGVGQLLRIHPSGGVEIIEVGDSVTSVAAAFGRRVAVVASPTDPAELVEVGAERRVLTDFNTALVAQARPIEPVELIATSTGEHPVHGWVFAPPTPGRHPVLLMIHGGPFAAYTPDFFDEAQVLAGAGYAVVMCNPRGSASYGQEHAKAIKHAFGSVDADDVLAFLDHAIDQVPGLDATRVGVMGGSYGGYLTAWLIAHTRRFAAAIVERAYLDGKSFTGASDIGWFFQHECHGQDFDAQSPLLLTSQVTTPTLVIHSENDLRCPLSVALRYYTELKQGGVDTELLVFPGEDHELSRSGTPHHRRARFEHILRWWQRHLPVFS